ncbi:MAG: sn-glycerol-3-phosphate ABC transporter ATP-binding protein UgpC [Pseudomonadota bacterium]|nr:sn-glycerol-3-phosphate ABC transporter ATP-binding protein UgpC [Pseudomonadota bacterium]
MADVHVVGVSKAYGDVEAVRDVSIHAPDGEFMVLVGPSGCGKSTILRMIAGLEGITAGEIRIGDRVVNDLAPRDRDVAMVFQNYALYPYKTVAENIGFPLRMRRKPANMVARRVAEVSGILNLNDLLGRYPRQLSGGQRQRVAMGRAIIRDPQVFLFDEPLSNLDAKLRVRMRGQIKELHQRLGATMIFVTHDQVEAMTMADRIVVLRDGVVEQIGAPLTLYDEPANTFVAGFIGSPAMNLLDGHIDGDGRRFLGGDGLAMPLAGTAPLKAGMAVVLGIRPEHLNIVSPGAAGSIAAEVVVVEPTGSETMVVARRGDIELTATSRWRPKVKAGERIGFKPDPAQLHLFNSAGAGETRLPRARKVRAG